jgi:sulfite reductase (NADPH) flavoprotein alpha-component
VPQQIASAPSETKRRDHKQGFRSLHLGRIPVTGQRSDKYTIHHEIGLQGAPVTYQPGDALGVLPENDPAVVERILKTLRATGDELVGSPEMPLGKALLTRYSLAAPSRRLLEILAGRGESDASALLEPARASDLKEYLNGAQQHDVLDVLEAHPHVVLTPAELTASLRTLLPRLYSIASSQLAHPDQVDVLVVSLQFTIRGRDRQGVTSSWLNERWPVNGVAEMYLQNQQSHFAMPPSGSTPMIMIGPGTGVAPFRAFLEERRATGATGRNWLFFGEQHRASEFYYQHQFEQYVRDGLLRFDTAFSRDQEQKVYVQHRMREHARDLWAWLEDGAEVFVCGDKARMASDVDQELHRIIETAGGKSADDAKTYVQTLKTQKRYKRDVY